jgi:hypothetical protein
MRLNRTSPPPFPHIHTHTHTTPNQAMSRYGLVWVYCLLFALYWAASCYWALITLKDAAEMRAVYNDRLGISEEELVSAWVGECECVCG